MRNDLLRLLGYCSAAGPDRPDRLICDDPRIKSGRAFQLREDRVQLAVHHRERLARISLVTGLPDGEDDLEPMGKRSDELFANLVIALAKEMAALRVAYEHEIAPSGEHRRRDLSRKRAGILPVHILGAEPDAGALQLRANCPQVRDRRGGGAHGASQRDTLVHRRVHLPVSGDHEPGRRTVAVVLRHRCAPSRSRSAATPGSVRPSRNSIVAPPPVEIKPILSATPASCTAAARSPPPSTGVAAYAASARATSRVPAAKAGIS